jgi:hypothetical protein
MPTVGASKKAVHRGKALRSPPLYGGLDQPGPYDCDEQIVKALVTATNGYACCVTYCRC